MTQIRRRVFRVSASPELVAREVRDGDAGSCLIDPTLQGVLGVARSLVASTKAGDE